MIGSVVIGANGLVGQNIYRELALRGEIVAGSCFSRDDQKFEKIDILNGKELKDFLYKKNPSKIFLCSNFPGGVNACEKNKEKAKKFHLDGLMVLIEVANKIKAKLIFISTDYVFADSPEPVEEDHCKAPLNYYGEIKDLSEELIKKEMDNYLIVRTTNIYGLDLKTKTPNYFMQVFNKLKAMDVVETSCEMYGTPTPASCLAKAIVELCSMNERGVFHIVGSEYVNRYEWAIKIADILGLDNNLVHKVEQKSGGVMRPLNLRLSTKKFNQVSSCKISTLDEELRSIRDQIKEINHV